MSNIFNSLFFFSCTILRFILIPVENSRSGGGTTNYTHNSANYTHNSANEYDTINSTNVTHDSAGNLQTDTAGYTYHYDHDNRLVTIKKNGDNDTVVDYTYDGLGRRIEKVDTVAGKTTRYYYDAQRLVLEEQTSQGSTVYRWFVYGNYTLQGSKFPRAKS